MNKQKKFFKKRNMKEKESTMMVKVRMMIIMMKTMNSEKEVEGDILMIVKIEMSMTMKMILIERMVEMKIMIMKDILLILN